MATFSALNTALSALTAQKRGLDVTGRNIANANTEGYSRQRVVMEAVGGQEVPALFSVAGTDGGEVRADRVERLRDVLLELRAHTEHSRQETLTTAQEVLAGVERVFGEPSDSGLQSQLGDFWNGWHDVANNPGDLAARSQLLQRASTLADSFNQTNQSLSIMWSNSRDRLGALVDEANTAAHSVAELNQAIQRATQAELPSSELSDKRDLLVVRLAELVGATAQPNSDGSVAVMVSGATLVRGATSNDLEVFGSDAIQTVGALPVGVRWKDSGNLAEVAGGSAAGNLEALNTVLPGFAGRLDTVAVTLRDKVNAQHVSGFSLTGAPGAPFFSGASAGTLAVAVTDASQVAAATTAGGNLGGGNADALAELSQASGGADQLYKRMVVDLGVDAETVNRRVDIQKLVTTQVDASRESSSGVDMDEEMTNMLAFQHAYSAAARLMSAVDEMIDTLINRTGMVGR